MNIPPLADLVVHLDDRWTECAIPGATAGEFPADGLIQTIRVDPGISAVGMAVAFILAVYAGDGEHEIAGPRLDVGSWATRLLEQGLHELADRGYITLTGGDGDA
jgi:hypothetical protein